MNNTMTVLFALVAWRKANNARKDYGDTVAIRTSLATNQWVPDNVVPATEITEIEKVEEMAEREAKWDALKSGDQNAEVLSKRAVFERLFVDPATGKLIEPKYSGNAGFRRASSFYDAMVERFTKKATAENPEPDRTFTGLVPIRVTRYATRGERLLDQQRENEIQNLGSKKMLDLEKLQVVKSLFDEGIREARIRDLYTATTGQKTFAICKANENWPELQIYNRFFLPPDNVDYIPWSPVRHNDLGKFNQRYTAQRKKAEGLVLNPTERTLEPIKPEEVNEYFDRLRRQDVEGPSKIMSKNDMTAAATNHKLKPVRAVLESVLSNTTNNLTDLMEHPTSINGVFDLVKTGSGDYIDDVVANAMAERDAMKEVVNLLKGGKKPELMEAIDRINNPVQTAETNGETAKTGKKKQTQTA